MKRKIEILYYEKSGDESLLSMEEVCRFVGIDSVTVTQFIHSGLIDALTEEPELSFAPEVIPRIRKIKRLQRDLGINLEGIGLALDLLDRITTLENELRYYRKMRR
jgi:chaperone modulatory protein CbpM